MKNLGTIVAAVFLAVVLGMYMCSYQVRFTDIAILKTWGKPAEEAVTKPGLYWKWPTPIQSVTRYDGRVRITEDRTEETRTVDGKNLILTTYCLWKISDPAKFNQSVPQGEMEAERKLKTIVVTHKNAVVGKRSLDEFISTDAARRKLEEIEKDMMTLVHRDALSEYGIEVVGFGIKKLGLPAATTTTIFQSMKANEDKKSSKYASEGEARYNDIVAAAQAARTRILAAVDSKVKEIQNQAREEEGRLYATFSDYPELRIYLDKLRAIKEAVSSRSTLILDSQMEPFDVADPATRKKVAGQASKEEGAAGDQPADQNAMVADRE